jgi:hypothetical protein
MAQTNTVFSKHQQRYLGLVFEHLYNHKVTLVQGGVKYAVIPPAFVFSMNTRVLEHSKIWFNHVLLVVCDGTCHTSCAFCRLHTQS